MKSFRKIDSDHRALKVKEDVYGATDAYPAFKAKKMD